MTKKMTELSLQPDIQYILYGIICMHTYKAYYCLSNRNAFMTILITRNAETLFAIVYW